MPHKITVQPKEFFNEETNRFINVKETTLVLEHSLISVSKWEAKYKKPFLVEGSLSKTEEILDYIKFMTMSPQNVDDNIYYALTKENLEEIIAYINDPMTATWFSEDKKQKPGRKKEVLTSEVIYWQMIALEIPQAYEKWHLNRLLTLIKVCAVKQEEQMGNNKMSKNDIRKQNSYLNAQRRAKLKSKG